MLHTMLFQVSIVSGVSVDMIRVSDPFSPLNLKSMIPFDINAILILTPDTDDTVIT